MTRTKPTFEHEELFWQTGINLIAGIDEVGRGAFAGPVVASAVIFQPNIKFTNSLLLEINDSKLLSAKKRLMLAELIKQESLCYAISEIDVPTINQIGIGRASQLALQKAVAQLVNQPEFCLIDAFALENFDRDKQKAIIHGDKISTSIAAASIIAKVYRDGLMERLHKEHPVYNFAKNKGYGTAYHRGQIGKYGLSKIHRTSFNLNKFIAP